MCFLNKVSEYLTAWQDLPQGSDGDRRVTGLLRDNGHGGDGAVVNVAWRLSFRCLCSDTLVLASCPPFAKAVSAAAPLDAQI
jgi:hypothetical protein